MAVISPFLPEDWPYRHSFTEGNWSKEERDNMDLVKDYKYTRLEPEERLLRDMGLRDENGWTQEALDILEQKLLDDNRDFLVTVAKDLNNEY